MRISAWKRTVVEAARDENPDREPYCNDLPGRQDERDSNKRDRRTLEIVSRAPAACFTTICKCISVVYDSKVSTYPYRDADEPVATNST